MSHHYAGVKMFFNIHINAKLIQMNFKEKKRKGHEVIHSLQPVHSGCEYVAQWV